MFIKQLFQSIPKVKVIIERKATGKKTCINKGKHRQGQECELV